MVFTKAKALAFGLLSLIAQAQVEDMCSGNTYTSSDTNCLTFTDGVFKDSPGSNCPKSADAAEATAPFDQSVTIRSLVLLFHPESISGQSNLNLYLEGPSSGDSRDILYHENIESVNGMSHVLDLGTGVSGFD